MAWLRNGTKMLFMSGYTEDAGVRGPDGTSKTFLKKPFTAAVLARKIREALDGWVGGRSGPEGRLTLRLTPRG